MTPTKGQRYKGRLGTAEVTDASYGVVHYCLVTSEGRLGDPQVLSAERFAQEFAAPPKAGPPQCARGCGWANDYAEPGFVCRKCQLWEGIVELGEPSAAAMAPKPKGPLYPGAKFRVPSSREVTVVSGQSPPGWWSFDLFVAGGQVGSSRAYEADILDAIQAGRWVAL